MSKKRIETNTLAQCGKDGYEMYRVPGVICLADGTILCYCDGRREDGTALFLFRSEDGGKSFGPRVTLAVSASGKRLHNPMMVQGKDGVLYFFWNSGYCRCFMKTSTDAGHTWSAPRELTQVFEGFRGKYPWKVFALSPGHGICTRSGRMILPVWMSVSEKHNPACDAFIYSDDGVNWQCGQIYAGDEQIESPTDSSVAELEDGSLLFTMRHNGSERRRAFARVVSMDGPWQGWLSEELPDPICAGALCRASFCEGSGAGVLLFCNCAWGDEKAREAARLGSPVRWSDDARQNLTVRISCNDGKSWSKGVVLTPKGGYSDLGISADHKKAYCFYEDGWQQDNCIYNERLCFARIEMDSLLIAGI